MVLAMAPNTRGVILGACLAMLLLPVEMRSQLVSPSSALSAKGSQPKTHRPAAFVTVGTQGSTTPQIKAGRVCSHDFVAKCITGEAQRLYRLLRRGRNVLRPSRMTLRDEWFEPPEKDEMAQVAEVVSREYQNSIRTELLHENEASVEKKAIIDPPSQLFAPEWKSEAKTNVMQSEDLGSVLEEIVRISKNSKLSEMERMRKIREFMPPPLSPEETEPGMSGETLVAKSFGHLNDLLFLDSWEEATGKYRPLKLYRGVPSTSMELLTSLQRLTGGGLYNQGRSRMSIESIKRVELGMIESFKKYAYGTARLGRDASLWEWLALAQHHGLPTRLLDWTKSPYVALHFATNKAHLMDEDAVVWVVDPYRYSMEYESFREYNDWLARHSGQRCWGVFNMDQLEGFYRWKTGRTKFLVPADADEFNMPFIFIEPPSLSRRVVNQWGCFSLIRTGECMDAVMKNMKPKYQKEINQRVPSSEARHTHVYRKIVIPARLKCEVRDKLDAIGFTERTLFPGLDGLCSYLRRYYNPDQSGSRALMYDDSMMELDDMDGQTGDSQDT